MNSRQKFTLLLFFLVALCLAHGIHPPSCPSCARGYAVSRLSVTP